MISYWFITKHSRWKAAVSQVSHFECFFVNRSLTIKPTCGLATLQEFIGNVDEPRYFMDTRRMDARILWFTEGFVEYQTPNYLNEDEKAEMIEISMEISSEFPFHNNNWPFDITFYLNDVELGTWTSPGDFADIFGKLTPEWYPDNLNQYGLFKNDSDQQSSDEHGWRTLIKYHHLGYSNP